MEKDNVIKFSKLLKRVIINNEPAYFVEIINNGTKENYISYNNDCNERLFILESDFKKINENEYDFYFKNISEKCIIKKQKKLDFLFCNSNITHFEVDCPSVFSAKEMFSFAKKLKVFNSDMPNLVFGNEMFFYSGIKKINNDFPLLAFSKYMFKESKIENFNSFAPNLTDASHMFYNSSLNYFKAQVLQNLKVANNAFYNCSIKTFNCETPNLNEADRMFCSITSNYVKIDLGKIERCFCLFEDAKIKKICINSKKPILSSGLFKNADISEIEKFPNSFIDKHLTFIGVTDKFKKNFPYLFL